MRLHNKENGFEYRLLFKTKGTSIILIRQSNTQHSFIVKVNSLPVVQDILKQFLKCLGQNVTLDSYTWENDECTVVNELCTFVELDKQPGIVLCAQSWIERSTGIGISVLEDCVFGDLFQVISVGGREIETEIPVPLGMPLPESSLKKHTLDVYNVDHIRYISAHIVLGLHQLHKRHLVHGDLKLENILVTQTQSDKSQECDDVRSVYLLSDFEFTSPSPHKCSGKTKFRGTKNTLAPEVFCGQTYGYSIDLWALGCVLYELMYKFIAFESTEYIIRGRPTPIQNVVNEEFWDLITNGLLQIYPSKRLCTTQIMQHAFFSGVDWQSLESELQRERINSSQKLHQAFDSIDYSQLFSPHSFSNNSLLKSLYPQKHPCSEVLFSFPVTIPEDVVRVPYTNLLNWGILDRMNHKAFYTLLSFRAPREDILKKTNYQFIEREVESSQNSVLNTVANFFCSMFTTQS